MQKVNSIFDVMGPIMIGPSSSHTAGAAKLARIAGSYAAEPLARVQFLLHGSFQTTYKGHGSDRALLAGIMGMDPSDSRLRDAYQLAEETGLEYEFIPRDLGNVHPNTIKFVMTGKSGNQYVLTGASIGGGEVEVTEIDGFKVSFSGNFHTIISMHNDVPGVVSQESAILSWNRVNIASVHLSRSVKGKQASMIIETDDFISDHTIAQLQALENVNKIIAITPPHLVKG